MTARALQRVVVRMLYDPALVDAVYAGRLEALADVPLTADERAWLVAPDRRRWAADPLRRTRGLQALLEEYPASGALAVRAEGVAALDRFFSAPAFHRCVQGRGSLADAFGRWLATGRPQVTAAMATLERGVARVRRAPPSPAPSAGGSVEGGVWRTAPWAFAATLPGDTLAAWHGLRARLARHPGGPVAALLDPRFDLGRPPRPGPEPEGIIVERDPAGDVAVGGCPPALATLLERLDTRPHTWAETADALLSLGAEADEVIEVAASLRDDGLLTRDSI